MKLSDIKARGRHRKDLGDIDPLMASIERLGILHPLVVDRQGRLIAGGRRLEACKRLGLKEVPVHVIDIENPLEAERDENLVRKDFTPSERVAIAEAIEAEEKKRARQRHKSGSRNGGQGGGKLPPPSRAKTRDVVARSVGWSGKTYEKAREVVAAAKADPKHRPVLETMDRTGNVSRAFDELNVSRLREEADTCAAGRIEDLEAAGWRYRTILCDPPWAYDDSGSQGAAARQYPTMSLEELARLPVGDLAHEDGAHLWLWATWPMIRDGAPRELLRAWGFQWKGEITWLKDSIGPGRWIRSQAEVLILAVRGDVPRLAKDVGGWLHASRSEHSRKPVEFYDVIEKFSPGPRIELFAREEREGWATWGFEA